MLDENTQKLNEHEIAQDRAERDAEMNFNSTLQKTFELIGKFDRGVGIITEHLISEYDAELKSIVGFILISRTTHDNNAVLAALEALITKARHNVADMIVHDEITGQLGSRLNYEKLSDDINKICDGE